jgi:uridine kinase
MNRTQVISDITDMIAGIYLDHPVRVGIDGVDVSGKTMLADELIEPLQSKSRTVIRVSVDGILRIIFPIRNTIPLIYGII